MLVCSRSEGPGALIERPKAPQVMADRKTESALSESIRKEQDYVSMLYGLLDAARDRSEEALSEVHGRGADGGTFAARMEREVSAYEQARRLSASAWACSRISVMICAPCADAARVRHDRTRAPSTSPAAALVRHGDAAVFVRRRMMRTLTGLDHELPRFTADGS